MPSSIARYIKGVYWDYFKLPWDYYNMKTILERHLNNIKKDIDDIKNETLHPREK
jgi:hypothetical protein